MSTLGQSPHVAWLVTNNAIVQLDWQTGVSAFLMQFIALTIKTAGTEVREVLQLGQIFAYSIGSWTLLLFYKNALRYFIGAQPGLFSDWIR